jgi:hypothetical protein
MVQEHVCRTAAGDGQGCHAGSAGAHDASLKQPVRAA